MFHILQIFDGDTPTVGIPEQAVDFRVLFITDD